MTLSLHQLLTICLQNIFHTVRCFLTWHIQERYCLFINSMTSNSIFNMSLELISTFSRTAEKSLTISLPMTYWIESFEAKLFCPFMKCCLYFWANVRLNRRNRIAYRNVCNIETLDRHLGSSSCDGKTLPKLIQIGKTCINNSIYFT